MRVNIQVFANLKDYFEPEFQLDVPEGVRVEGVLRIVGDINPNSRELLNACRVAVDEDFVRTDYVLANRDTLVLLPPSSGG